MLLFVTRYRINKNCSSFPSSVPVETDTGHLNSDTGVQLTSFKTTFIECVNK